MLIRRHARRLLKQAAATSAAQLKLELEISKGKVKIVQHTVCKLVLRARAAKYEREDSRPAHKLTTVVTTVVNQTISSPISQVCYCLLASRKAISNQESAVAEVEDPLALQRPFSKCSA